VPGLKVPVPVLGLDNPSPFIVPPGVVEPLEPMPLLGAPPVLPPVD